MGRTRGLRAPTGNRQKDWEDPPPNVQGTSRCLGGGAWATRLILGLQERCEHGFLWDPNPCTAWTLRSATPRPRNQLVETCPSLTGSTHRNAQAYSHGQKASVEPWRRTAAGDFQWPRRRLWILHWERLVQNIARHSLQT